MTDADGNILHEGDRVYTYDFDGKRFYGTLKPNEGYEHISEWYVEYDDGGEYCVLDFKQLWKA